MDSDPGLWVEYALGLLDEDVRRRVEQQLEHSEDARNALAEAIESLSTFGEGESPLRPPDSVRAAVLAAVRPERRFEGFVDRMSTFLDLATSNVRALVRSIDVATDPDGGWQPDEPGTLLYHFEGGPRVAEADCGLVRVEAGSGYPAHRHLGDEWNFVLSGTAREDSGAVWNTGDVVHRKAGSVHSFRVIGDEPLVFAVVLHGGIEIQHKGPSS